MKCVLCLTTLIWIYYYASITMIFHMTLNSLYVCYSIKQKNLNVIGNISLHLNYTQLPCLLMLLTVVECHLFIYLHYLSLSLCSLNAMAYTKCSINKFICNWIGITREIGIHRIRWSNGNKKHSREEKKNG